MQKESRVQRWRANKREQGLKHVSVWLTPEEELRLKDLAVQWHCSPSEVMQQALAQVHRVPQAEHSNPTDTLQIRTLILAELAALGLTLAGAAAIVTGGELVGPTETLPQSTAIEIPLNGQYEPEPGQSIVTEPTPQSRGGRRPSPERQQILALLAEHPEGLTAEQIRVYITAEKSLRHTLHGMKRSGALTTQGQGQGLRYFVTP